MKVSYSEAAEIVKQARQKQVKHGWRFGQALFISIPSVITELHTNKESDFYYWSDDRKILDCFYDNFVEF